MDFSIQKVYGHVAMTNHGGHSSIWHVFHCIIVKFVIAFLSQFNQSAALCINTLFLVFFYLTSKSLKCNEGWQ